MVHLPYTRRDDVKSESYLKKKIEKLSKPSVHYLQAAVSILVLAV